MYLHTENHIYVYIYTYIYLYMYTGSLGLVARGGNAIVARVLRGGVGWGGWGVRVLPEGGRGVQRMLEEVRCRKGIKLREGDYISQ